MTAAATGEASLLPASAPALLAGFARAGILSTADVHVAVRLGVLTGEHDPRVLLALALTVRGTRHGSVVCDLAEVGSIVAPDPAGTGEPSGSTVTQGPLPGPTETEWPELSEWLRACAASPLCTGAAGGPPLRMVGSRLWLDRYWCQEERIAEQLLRRSAQEAEPVDPARLRADLDALFSGEPAPDQRLAVATAALSWVSVIAGGPGTGKTTTVAQLIAVLVRSHGAGLRIALAAPTGKAAARLQEAVRSAGGGLDEPDREVLSGMSASTLHRLLGSRPGSARFRHHAGNHLPFDVVIVDECSMVSLTLMSRLVEALAPGTRLVLVGDPDQLASVEAGAVLGDLVDPADVGGLTAGFRRRLSEVTDVPPGPERPDGRGAELRDSVVQLRTVYRFDAGGAIAELSGLVRAGRADEALELLRAQPAGVQFCEVADDRPLSGRALGLVQARCLEHERAIIRTARVGDGAGASGALDALDRHRLLCAHRSGPRGVGHWSEQVRRWLATDIDSITRGDGRYPGLPLLVTANDYEAGLYNGDCGVVVARPATADADMPEAERLVAVFRRGADPMTVPMVRLGQVRALHAMTVHRAQGSQFDAVTVLMPAADSPLATRQMFYTAITRAAASVLVIGSAESVLASVRRPIARASGLRERLAAAPQ